MNILLINKFLHPNGGSETYIFKLGDYLKGQGHVVEYFGMDHEKRIVGNRVNSYTQNMDFHGDSRLKKLIYPLKTIYNIEARKRLRAVLEDLQPDVCHINNFNYQLTPSIILEIVAWRRRTGKKCRIVYTAHDYQLVCPNHMCSNPNTHENCEKCLGGHFFACLKGKCIHGSAARSAIGTAEAVIWNTNGVYKYLDKIICCSNFLKNKMDTNPLFATKTTALHNFVERVEYKPSSKQPYVIYFGRYSEEKGIGTLIKVCRELPDIPFVFVGDGPLKQQIETVANIRNMGFQTGKELEQLVREARFSVYPSEWYENCPFSVMESQMYGTPVLGADIGGIPELIQPGVTGELFPSGDGAVLKTKIRALWDNPEITTHYSANCESISFLDIQEYCAELLNIYQGEN